MIEQDPELKPGQQQPTQREMTVYQYEAKPPNTLAYGIAGVLFGAIFGILIPYFIISGDPLILQNYFSSLIPSGASLDSQLETAAWTIYAGFFIYISVFSAIVYFIAAGRSALAAVGLVIFLAGPAFVVLMLR